MTTVSTFIALKRAVTRLVKAEVDHSWMGAGDPADYIAIQQELDNAQSNYKYQLERVRTAFLPPESV